MEPGEDPYLDPCFDPLKPSNKRRENLQPCVRRTFATLTRSHGAIVKDAMDVTDGTNIQTVVHIEIPKHTRLKVQALSQVPPATAPITSSGSLPVATTSGSNASGESCDRSS